MYGKDFSLCPYPPHLGTRLPVSRCPTAREEHSTVRSSEAGVPGLGAAFPSPSDRQKTVLAHFAIQVVGCHGRQRFKAAPSSQAAAKTIASAVQADLSRTQAKRPRTGLACALLAARRQGEIYRSPRWKERAAAMTSLWRPALIASMGESSSS